LYVLVLLLSSLLFILAYRYDTSALALLVFLLCAIAVLMPVLVISTRITDLDGDVWREPVGLCESRLFDVLSSVAFLHFVLFPLRRGTVSVTALVALVLQTVLFVLIYHSRSSLGWQVLAVGVVSAVFAVKAVRGLRPLRALRGGMVCA